MTAHETDKTVDREILVSRADEAETLLIWYTTRNPGRYSLVMRLAGSVADFRNDVWIRMLTSLADGHTVNCGLATFVIMNARWEISRRLQKKQDILWHDYRRCPLKEAMHEVGDDGSFDAHESLIDLLIRIRKAVKPRTYWILWKLAGVCAEDVTAVKTARSLKISRERVRQLIENAAYDMAKHGVVPVESISDLNRECKARKRMMRTECGRVLLEDITQPKS
jgi:hypothetical protein